MVKTASQVCLSKPYVVVTMCIEKIYSVSALVGNGTCNANCAFCAGKYLRKEANKKITKAKTTVIMVSIENKLRAP